MPSQPETFWDENPDPNPPTDSIYTRMMYKKSITKAKNIYQDYFTQLMPSSSHAHKTSYFYSTLERSRFSVSLESCKTIDQVKQIHSLTIQKGVTFDSSKIIAFCCKNGFGDMKYANNLFDKIPNPNIITWNTMIRGYSCANLPKDAIFMYKQMLNKNVKPDSYTYPFLLKGFTCDVALGCGEAIHGHVWKFGFGSSQFVQQALIHMYCLCEEMVLAHGVFDASAKGDVISWNEMISGYNRIKRHEESRKLFDAMEGEEKQVSPTSVTLVSVLSACSQLKDLDGGKRAHGYVKERRVDSGLRLENALIDLYASCGEMDDALGVFMDMKSRDVISWTSLVKGFVDSGQVDLARVYFNQMPEKDSVSWTAMIDGYLRDSRYKDVLLLFCEMQARKVKPDEFTMVSVLSACTHLGALGLGEWIKTYMDKYKIKSDAYVGNALIDMYFKCGDVEKAVGVYRKMPRKDKFTWTNMIVGFAINGHGKEALDMFSQMLRASERPDEITYIGVLCACTHTGLVDEGREFFARMTIEHGIQPNLAHYGCMVDLLGRVGKLKEAYEVIRSMPMKPNSVVWGALLGACRVHKNVDMAEMAAKELLELDPENGGVYVLLCNIYAACKKWESLQEVRQLMMDKGIKKSPGCSLIEMNGVVHEFVAGDRSHCQSEEIYLKLQEMTEDLRRFAGYLPDTSEVFLDTAEEEKVNAVNRHSEKLAIAFALINSRHVYTESPEMPRVSASAYIQDCNTE